MSEHSTTKRKSGIYREGVIVAIGLAILTGVEFYIALSLNSFAIMMILGVLKAILVVNYFMHIRSLWSEDGH
jgi:hypothetical protein